VAIETPKSVLEIGTAEDSRMGNGMNWIANTFKFFDALIGPRKPPQPDRRIAPLTQSPTRDVGADRPPVSIVRVEPEAEVNSPSRQDARIEPTPTQEVETLPVQQDGENRRALIRQLFNDYWTGIEDKPPTFAERLAIAEGYINARLADRDVGWRLDGTTRKQLGLPSPQ
jgi:hypothetical protein